MIVAASEAKLTYLRERVSYSTTVAKENIFNSAPLEY